MKLVKLLKLRIELFKLSVQMYKVRGRYLNCYLKADDVTTLLVAVKDDLNRTFLTGLHSNLSNLANEYKQELLQLEVKEATIKIDMQLVSLGIK